MVRYHTKTARFCVSGTEVLRCRLSLPEWEGREKINAFYRQVGEHAFRFCETRLRELAEGAFEESADEKKKFRFPPFSYLLEVQVTENGDEATVSLLAQWRQKGVAEPLAVGRDTHIWQISEEQLVPPRKEKKPKKKKEKSGSSV